MSAVLTRGRSVPAHEVLRCSFCTKMQDQVGKLIAGPSVFICDECIAVCVDIMVDGLTGGEGTDAADEQRWAAIAARIGRTPGQCSLCDSHSSRAMLPIEGRGLLCGDCADAIDEALSRGRVLSDGDKAG